MIICVHGSHLTSSDGRAYSVSSPVLVSRAAFMNKTKKKINESVREPTYSCRGEGWEEGIVGRE